MILVVLASSAGIATLLAVFMLVLEITLLILKRKKFYFGTIAISVLCIACSSAFTILSRSILLVSGGLLPR